MQRFKILLFTLCTGNVIKNWATNGQKLKFYYSKALKENQCDGFSTTQIVWYVTETI